MRGIDDDEPTDGEDRDDSARDSFNASSPSDIEDDGYLGDFLDDDFDLPNDTAEFRALGDLDMGSLTPSAGMLPPEDRLWRHPSELQFMAPPAPAAATRSATAWPILVGVALGAGLIGALIAAGTVRMTDGDQVVMIERQVEQVEPVAGLNDISASIRSDYGVAAAQITPAVARVTVPAIGGTVTCSGVIFLAGDGRAALMTSATAVGASGSVQVDLVDGRRFDGLVVGVDRRTDVAVITIAGNDLPVAPLGSSSSVGVGDVTLLVTGPLDTDGKSTVATSMVSAIGRGLQETDGERRIGLLQTDRPLAATGAGGALVDLRGGVIGITTTVDTDAVATGGVSFATPIAVAHDAAMELLFDGEASHPWMGIKGGDDDDEPGLVVAEVIETGPAADAGVAPGDVITAVEDTTIHSMNDLLTALQPFDPGDEITLQMSNGQNMDLVLGERQP